MMTHNCGQPSDQCTCLTQGQLDSLSPDLRRIVVNAHQISQEAAQARREQALVINCDEDEDADEYEEADEEAGVSTNRSRFNNMADLDMVPPTLQHAEDERDHRNLTFNRAEVDEGVRRLWAAADGPYADV